MNKANLDLIMEFKTAKEKRLAKELIMIWNRLSMKKDELNIIKKKKQRLILSLRDAQKDIIDIHRIELISQNISYTNVEINKLEQKIMEIKKEYEIKLKELLEAVKQRKLIEKLRERWIRREQYEMMKKEQIFFDEIANNNFIYKNA